MRRVWRWVTGSVILLLVAAVPLGWRAAPAGAAAETLLIGQSTWVGYGPLFLARDKRFFDEAGVSVELKTFEDPKTRFFALVSGKLDGIATTLDTASLYWSTEHPFRSVLGLDDSKGGDGIVAVDTITSIKDLRGKRVAYNKGSVSHFFLSVLLRQNGMTEKDIQSIQMQQDDAGAAFVARKVDAAVTWEPWLSRAKKTPGGHILVDSSTTPGLIVDILLFRSDIIKNHPDAVKAAVQGWFKAVDYWKRNPDESDLLMAKAVGGWLKDVKTFRETLDGVRFYDEAINRQYFGLGGQIYVTAQNAIDIWKSFGMIRGNVAAADLVDPEFINK
ncbi:MAG TPA: ABC transporter substrate-binding protein [bacterium]|nr:ABC transporter substrate-binding protein [bacterium]